MTTDDTEPMVSDCPDDLLVAALLSGATYEVAGRSVGVSKSTVVRRMNERAFRARLDQFRFQLLQRASDRLVAHSLAAVEVLAEVMVDTDTNAGTRVRAARDLLDLNVRYRDTVDLSERVVALEAALEARVQHLARRTAQ